MSRHHSIVVLFGCFLSVERLGEGKKRRSSKDEFWKMAIGRRGKGEFRRPMVSGR